MKKNFIKKWSASIIPVFGIIIGIQLVTHNHLWLGLIMLIPSIMTVVSIIFNEE